jgi:hypothetical protein
MQLSVVTLTDLLLNLWLRTIGLNNKNLMQCIPCRGHNYRNSVANKYQTLPTQTICSVQRTMKIITVIVIILIIIPTEPRWPARDTGAQKRSTLCNNIIPQNNISCRPQLRFQINWRLRLGCQGRVVKIYVIRIKQNPPCTRILRPKIMGCWISIQLPANSAVINN